MIPPLLVSAGGLLPAVLIFGLFPATSLATDLLAYWNFDDASSPTITLDSVNNYSGSLEGGAAYTADLGGHSGQVGDRGMDFGTTDGGQTVHIANASFLNSATVDDEITISFWQKLSAVTSSSTFWAASPSSSNNQRGMQIHLPWSDGTIYYDSAGCCGSTTRATAPPPGGFDWTVWHHYAVIKNGATKQVWIDGALVLNAGGAAALPSDFTSLDLGSEFGNNSLQGVLDEFAVFDEALTPTQIASLASGTAPPVLFQNSDLPALTVTPATTVTTTTATLSGTVTAVGIGAPSVTIFYGDDDAGNNANGWDHSVALPGTHSGAFSSNVSNLNTGTTYFFTARATNAGGGSWSGETESFTTVPLSPSVVNVAATNVQAFAATIGASVTATGGQDPVVTLYYGTSDAGTNAGNWDASHSLGTTATGGSMNLSGLSSGTPYYFRAFAANSGGASWAPTSATFTTVISQPATVVNQPADEITGSSARLRGAVLAIGNDPPTITIFYGTSDGGTAPGSWSLAVSDGVQSDSFSRRVSLLSPETTYFFRARAVNASGTSWAPETATFTTPVATGLTVVINEIHHDAEPKTEPAEFVELLNAGDLPVDLSGWRLEGAVDYTFPGGTSLNAGAFLVVAQNTSALQSAFGVNTPHQFSKSLDNDGEELRLIDAVNTEVDRVNYRSGFPWPTAARGTGRSMELLHPGLDNNLGGAWRSSSTGPIGPNVTYVSPKSTWRYRKGTSEASNPIDAWRMINFTEDNSWTNGDAVIGYGDGDDDTLVTDMEDNYSTIYFRKEFVVSAGAIPSRLLVRCYIDDGAIVWINGVEVARFSVTGGTKFFDSLGTNHDSVWEEQLVNNAGNVIIGGTNVIAVHGLNTTLGSSDFSFDLELKTPDASTSTGQPTPGAPNTVSPVVASSAPPLIRQVDHSPKQPAAGEEVLMTAKVSDLDGVNAVSLSYQVVTPGGYIRLTDPAYDNDWVTVNMVDDGTGGDLLAGDAIFSATLAGSVQVHRRLVRYRITAEDSLGNSLQVPYPDDESPNFAYFVYNGIPAWTAAEQPGTTRARRFPSAMMNDALPIYHLLANSSDVTNSQYSSNSDGVRMRGTLVYDGKVYDHIEFYNRGEASTYVSGKNKWRFKFNRARDFEARDIYGKRYQTSWKTMNFNACSSPWVAANRGIGGLDEAVPHRLHQLAGVVGSNTHWVQFRIVDGAVEAPGDQYSGDLWGLYLAIEHPDGRMLNEHGLPDGNLYKIQNGNGDKKNQGPTHPTNSSDWSSFYSASANLNTVAWWRRNFDLASYYGFRAINRATSNVDLRDHTNYFMYHHTNDRWHVVPWDLDMMYAPVLHVWSGVIRADRCLDHDEIHTEFRNRCRELVDLLFSDSDRHGGHAAQVVEELSQVINPSGVSLTMVDADQFMWSHHPRTAGSHRGPWYALSKFETRLANNYYRTIPTADHEGFQQNLIDYMHDTDTDRFSVGDGDEDGYGYNHLSMEAADSAIPNTPNISYSGEANFPADGVRFTSGAFRDPQGSGSFAAMQWRIGEISNPSTPGYQAGEPWVYEVETAWESAEIAPFAAEMNFPTIALRPGHTYRARVKHLDNTARWSHWSAPVEFVATAPGIAEYIANLMVTEVMYNPLGGSDYEFIEIKNIGGLALDLTDVRFTKGIDYDFPANTMIDPGEILLVVRNRAIFESRYGAGLPIAGEWQSGDNLGNSGEQVKLSYGAGTAIQDFTYLDVAPWPTAPDGPGYSLTLRNPSSAPDHSLPASWRASSVVHGTPGTDDLVSGYDDWAALHFTPAELQDPLVSGPGVDLDNDGLNNLAESYFNGNPRIADPSPGAAGEHNGLLALSFTRRVGASAYLALQLHTSSDLVSWTHDALAQIVTIVDNADGTETLTVASSEPLGNHERFFLRLELTSQE